MPPGQLLPLLRCIRKMSQAPDGEADRALLERFARQRDGEAFAALVRRHGPMVRAVCRRALRDGPDADDAFQAVFLLLVRKAASLRRPEHLGPWLHGVAHRIALKARALLRRRREEPLLDLPAAPADDDLVWRDLRPALDDAIRSLPARYRAPVVLCYLEGMTQAEAARHLGCPPGTIATRLSRARDQLRARLVRRGVTLSAGVLAVALGARAEASLPPALLGSALRALVSSSAIPSHVTALTEGVSQAMLMEKLRFVVMALVAAAAVGALALGYRSGAAEPPLPVAVPPPAVPVAPPAANEEAAAVVRTKNFLITAPNARVARLIADAAERQRKEKAVLWLGEELPAWEERCPIKVRIGPGGCGGATTFSYDGGTVARREMHVEGALDWLLSSVLPHEVTHTVFADFFGAPAPRWADEGGCVMSEDEEEQQRHERLMREMIEKERLIPLPRLLKLKEYPDDVMALFAEGHSLTRFLVEKKDRKTFLAFVKQGMKDGWDGAVKERYGFRDVEELERAWLQEVRKEPKTYPVVEYSMPVERTGLPEEGPVPGVARLQPDGKGVVLEVIRTKMHYRLTALRDRDGGRTNGGLRPLVGHQRLEVALPFSEVKAYRTGGTAIDAKKLAELLKKETPVLVAPDRSAVHERWLQLVKEDTLVIVVKATELGEKKETTPPTITPVPAER